MPAPLRLWPGVALVTLQWLLWAGLPLVAPDIRAYGLFGGIGVGLLVILWWLFFSRAPWLDRIGVVVAAWLAVAAAYLVVDKSIAGGAMGNMLRIYVIPNLCLGLDGACVIARHRSVATRRALTLVAILLACGWFTLLRTGGVSGDGAADIHWRWTPTPEQRLMAQTVNEPAPAVVPVAATAPLPATTPAAVTPPRAAASNAVPPDSFTPAPVALWPGFRGPSRDDVVRGMKIDPDWTAKPPVEIWRRTIGPGWSSFAVAGDLIYTQEQRGESEIVSAYSLASGTPIWMHKDQVRFYESNGGPGPRATPAVASGRVFSLGATGVLNALDARTGAVLWTRNAVTDTGVTIPGWGIAGSPLVVGDTVIVAASGRLSAYDAGTGTARWMGPNRGGSYASPHLMTIGGVDQVVMQSGAGVTSVAPADGRVLWQHDWEGAAILQPVLTPDGDLLVTTADMMGGLGTRRIAVSASAETWTVQERWTSRGLKPYFNDIVVHGGFAYGFDGSILSCIDLKDGERKWKGGRYGNGQLVLIADQDLLLVLTEEGDLALVRAAPDAFTEVARHPAIDGKTWNHLVLVRDVLLVRNGEEMVAFRVSLSSDSR